MLLTFGLTVFAWIFFRAENIGHAFNYISEILSKSIFALSFPLPPWAKLNDSHQNKIKTKSK